LADLWRVSPQEIIFTSGGTESDVLAIRGLALAAPEGRRVAWFFALEHPAVSGQRDWLVAQGFDVRCIPSTTDGFVDLETWAPQVDSSTFLCAVMHVNNELGTIQPIQEIRQILDERAPGAMLHVDAVQSFTKTPVHPGEMGASTLAIAAHKFHGPKGVGALYVRQGTPLEPLVVGGGHEQGRRAGTLNAPGIVGMVHAAVVALDSFEQTTSRIGELRDALYAGIRAGCPQVQLNGSVTNRQCNNLNIHIPSCSGWALLAALEARGVIASAGSACQSSHGGPSAVLQAIGRTAPGSANLRLTLSRMTTSGEIETAIPRIVEAIQSIT
jgi:cysteine desulfurase